MARLGSGSRVPRGRVVSAAPRIGKVRGGGVRKTTAHMAGFKQGVQGRGIRVSSKNTPLTGTVARGHIAGSKVRSNAMKHGARVGRGASAVAQLELGTLGGAAAFAAGGYGVSQMVENHHNRKKALTARQLQQRRNAARSKRTAGVSGRV